MSWETAQLKISKHTCKQTERVNTETLWKLCFSCYSALSLHATQPLPSPVAAVVESFPSNGNAASKDGLQSHRDFLVDEGLTQLHEKAAQHHLVIVCLHGIVSPLVTQGRAALSLCTQQQQLLCHFSVLHVPVSHRALVQKQLIRSWPHLFHSLLLCQLCS